MSTLHCTVCQELPLSTVRGTGFRGALVEIVASSADTSLGDEGAASRLLGAAVESTRVVSLDRWDSDRGGSELRFGSLCERWALFDSQLHAVSPSEAALMDASQRRVLAHASDLALSERMPHDTAVAAAVGRLAPQELVSSALRRAADQGATTGGTGIAASAVAGRVSYSLDLRGPCITVDTACSSSLVATSWAVDAIRVHTAPASIVAGCSLPLARETSVLFAAAGMLSKSGRCLALDVGADGYVRAEACVVFLLRPFRGSSYGRRPRPLLVACRINQDGRSSSLTAPNGPSQTSVVLDALRDANAILGACASHDGQNALSVSRCMPDEIQLHGTGTPLGDPIEVGALRGIFDFRRSPKSVDAVVCTRLSAAKTALGHAETAAGACGILAASATLEARCAQPLPCLRSLNPYVAAAVDSARDVGVWLAASRSSGPTAPAARTNHENTSLVGISAFAFQGTNAHILLCGSEPEAPVRSCTSDLAMSALAPSREGKRLWHAPPPHPLLRLATANREKAPVLTFATAELSPRSAILFDHRVRGTSLVPAAGTLEAFSSIAATAGEAAGPALLLDAVFSAPWTLDARRDSALITLELVTGNVVLRRPRACGGAYRPLAAAVAASQQENSSISRPPCGKASLDRMWNPHLGDAVLCRSPLFAPLADSRGVRVCDASLSRIAQADAGLHLAGAGRDIPTQTRVPVAVGAFRGPGLLELAFTHAVSPQFDGVASVAASLRGVDGLPCAEILDVRFDSMGSSPISDSVTQKRGPSQNIDALVVSCDADATRQGAARPPACVSLELLNVKDSASGVSLHIATNHALTSVQIPLLEIFKEATRSRRVDNARATIWEISPSPLGAGEVFSIAAIVASAASAFATLTSETGTSVAVSRLGLHTRLAETGRSGQLEPVSAGGCTGGVHLSTRLTAASTGGAAELSPPFFKRCYVAGSNGGIGRLLAEYFCLCGIPSLVLQSRTGRHPKPIGGDRSISCELVSAHAASLADRAPHRCSHAAIYLASGHAPDAPIAGQTPTTMRLANAPKGVALASSLEPLLSAVACGPVILFSSISALLGTAGQLSYASANGALDGAAHGLRRAGLVVTSIQWGPWQGLFDGGMATPDVLERASRRGVGAISPVAGLLALERATAPRWLDVGDAPRPLVLAAMRDSRLALGSAWASDTTFSGVLGVRTGRRPSSPRALDERPRASTEVGHRASAFARASSAWVAAEVRQAVASTLSRPSDRSLHELGDGAAFGDLGLESLEAAELARTLESRLGVQLPATLAYDHPTLSRLTEAVLQAVADAPRRRRAHEEVDQIATTSDPDRNPRLSDRGAFLIEGSGDRSALDLVRDLVVSVAGAPPDSDDAPLAESGVDSLGAGELASALERALGVSVPTTIVYDYPSVARLAEWVHERHASSPDHVAAVGSDRDNSSSSYSGISSPPFVDPGEREVSVLVTGISARYPSSGAGLRTSAFTWTLSDVLGALGDGSDAVLPVPPSRWDVEASYDPTGLAGTAYVRLGSWLTALYAFDAQAFALSLPEAALVDPQSRGLLHVAHEALHARAIANTALDRAACGVFVGCMYAEYLDSILTVAGLADVASGGVTGHGLSFMVGRVSYSLGLQGPCVSTDTACSSSLVALHLAARHSSRHLASALAGGTNASLEPKTTARICLLKALSPAGRCQALDAQADGYGRGEAVATALLEGVEVGVNQTRQNAAAVGAARLAPHHYAVVAAAAINQDGRSSSLTAPNGPAQTALIRTGVADAGTNAPLETPVAFSLHGTGTPLGDPIEISALGAAFASRRKAAPAASLPSATPLAVAATKGVFAHTEGVAGLTSLFGAVAAVSARFLAPMSRLASVNPHVVSAGREWAKGGLSTSVARHRAPLASARRGDAAGASSFGMSGVNAFALLRASEFGGRSVDAARPPWRAVRCAVLPELSKLYLRPTVPSGRRVQFAINLAVPATVFLKHHVVGGRTIVPASATLEAMREAARSVGGVGACIAATAFAAPVRFSGDATMRIDIDVSSGAVSTGDAETLNAVTSKVWRLGHFQALEAPRPFRPGFGNMSPPTAISIARPFASAVASIVPIEEFICHGCVLSANKLSSLSKLSPSCFWWGRGQRNVACARPCLRSLPALIMLRIRRNFAFFCLFVQVYVPPRRAGRFVASFRRNRWSQPHSSDSSIMRVVLRQRRGLSRGGAEDRSMRRLVAPGRRIAVRSGRGPFSKRSHARHQHRTPGKAPSIQALDRIRSRMDRRGRRCRRFGCR